MKTFTISTKRGNIEFVSKGKGIPVLFIHGGHSNCKETLLHKGFDLTKFNAIVASRPGYGKTTLNNNESPRQAAALFIELLDYLNLEKVIIYGISAGGLTAIELAGNFPERVNKLILASAVSKKWLDPNGKIYKTTKKLFHPGTERIVWGMIRFFSLLTPGLIAKSFYTQFTTNLPHKLNKSDVKELTHTFKYFRSKKGFLNDVDQNTDDVIITKIKCPALIVHSKNDKSVSYEHALHSNKMIKNSELLSLDNEWGHLFWIGADSKKTIEKIIEFIGR